MGGIFSIDGPFYKFGSLLWDIMALSFLWIVFSIPVFTVGASTTALYYITTRRLSNKEGYLFRDFWKSFKSNFKQATIVWLIIMLIGVVLLVDLYLLVLMPELLGLTPTFRMVLVTVQLAVLVELVFNILYIFPIISRFEMKTKVLFKTTLILIHKHLPTTLILAAMFAVVLIGIFWYGNTMIFVFASGLYAYAASFFFVKIFKKYHPEMDADPDELEASEIEK